MYLIRDKNGISLTIRLVGKIRRPKCMKCGRKIRDWRKVVFTEDGIFCIYCAKEVDRNGANSSSNG